jgi:peptide/nickel transport system substrate-binding protein
VKLEKLANATMRDRVGKGDYDIAIGNWSPDFADPYMFMNYWFESDKKGCRATVRSMRTKRSTLLRQAAPPPTRQNAPKITSRRRKPLSTRPPTSICSRRTTSWR